MRELRTMGSVRGALSNGRPYRNPRPTCVSESDGLVFIPHSYASQREPVTGSSCVEFGRYLFQGDASIRCRMCNFRISSLPHIRPPTSHQRQTVGFES